MAKTVLGKVCITPTGAWNQTTRYERLTAVEYDGSSYVAKQDNTGVTPGTDSDVWMLLAKKGEAFTFEDFTQEQIALLQQPATEAAEQAIQAATMAKDAAEEANDAAKEAMLAAKSSNDAAQAANTAAANVKSAYDAAVEGGFTGTEEDFNTSIASIGQINEVLDEINGEVI